MSPFPETTRETSTEDNTHEQKSRDGEDRIRRNVACVNCRNSKSRCKASSIPGQPCQRCAKLRVSCVVDKFHKRVTRKSKLEQLEQELNDIKRAVKPDQNPRWSSNSPQDEASPEASQTLPEVMQAVLPHNGHRLSAAGADDAEATLPGGHRGKLMRLPIITARETEPTAARMLGNFAMRGEDIDWYFDRYLVYFHPFLPVLRKSAQIPNDCYKASPTLFWTIICVAGRKYMTDENFFASVIQHVSTDIWTAAAKPTVSIEIIHALLLVCYWPFLTVKFINDPSMNLTTLAMNACTSLGLHFGKGSHPEFCIGPRANFRSSDEDAAATWLSSCIVAQRVASNSGFTLPSMHYNDGPCFRALASPEWYELLSVYEMQKYLNKFNMAVLAQISAHEYVPEHMVTDWDNEFETLRPQMARIETDIISFSVLAAKLEIRTYYFFHDTTQPPTPTLRTNSLKVFHTARSLINASHELEERSQFLSHAPHWVFRTTVDAASVILAMLHSTYTPEMPVDEANMLAQRAFGAVMKCSNRHGDLPYRAAVVQETFWNARYAVPVADCGPGAWKHRLGAGLVFWCINHFKTMLLDAKKAALQARNPHGAGVMRGYGAGVPANAASGGVGGESGESIYQAANALQTGQDSQQQQQQQQAVPSTTMPMDTEPVGYFADPMEDIDWTQIMDDFGWGGGPGQGPGPGPVGNPGLAMGNPMANNIHMFNSMTLP